MSSSLGTGFVALTPINLDTIPSPQEGSKAGLLTLWWNAVKAANKAYVQPVSLLLAYQQGQFSTVQAVLIDNSQVGYPVTLLSQSTGQRIVVGPYTTQMTPVLVSVAPTFTVTLNAPASGAADQVSTLIFFLNTPQTPFVQTTNLQQVSATALKSSTALFSQSIFSGTLYPVDTLYPSFPPGTLTVTYVSLSMAVTVISPFVAVSGGAQLAVTLAMQTSHGSNVTYNTSAAVALGQTGLVLSVQFDYPANVTDVTGDPILLQTTITSGFAAQANFSVGYSFYYTAH